MASSAQVCMWRAMQEKLPTRGNLVRRGVSVVICVRCVARLRKHLSMFSLIVRLHKKCGITVIDG